MKDRFGLGARLLAAHLLVLVAAVGATELVATALGPSIFRAHLRQAHTADPQLLYTHAEQAFREASTIAWTLALVTAVLVALAVSVFVSRRIARPVGALAAAASEVSSGRYGIVVPAPALGPEFDSLTSSFNAMAARLDRIEATRRRLLSDLGHEMRTPVAVLDAYLEGIEDGVAQLDPETVLMLRTQTRRLSRLAEDISAVSRAEEHRLDLHLTPTAAADLIPAALATAADRYAEKGVLLQSDIDPDTPLTMADRDRLDQVLGNLLDNALRHSSPGHAVTVTAAPEGDSIVLKVIDTGDGIAPQHLPHIFERFYRVDAARDSAHGGSGIGLTIARAIVEAHGGKIEAASDNRGTTFTMSLPALLED